MHYECRSHSSKPALVHLHRRWGAIWNSAWVYCNKEQQPGALIPFPKTKSWKNTPCPLTLSKKFKKVLVKRNMLYSFPGPFSSKYCNNPVIFRFQPQNPRARCVSFPRPGSETCVVRHSILRCGDAGSFCACAHMASCRLAVFPLGFNWQVDGLILENNGCNNRCERS